MIEAQRTRSEQKRQQIVAAASSLFMQHGYLSTSMDEVAQQAGVSKQTVYAHFGSKDDLFTYCIESKCVVATRIPDTLEGQDPQQVLTEFMRAFSEMIHSEEALYVYRLCVTQAESHPELSRRYFEAGPLRVQRVLADYLAKLQRSGKLSLPDPMLAAEQLLLMGRGMRHLACELGLPCEESQRKSEQRLSSAITLFLSGYGYQG
ncbi:TetR/AcrR family transcriptional regulator [Ferrimonas gelatinilytica]|uniref:TetR/AcrR family transcriptional regulator n=1 Tax=Ferrimonas gelatinilytica TaxID=1255257 RepID=A0ABP9RZA6_9GAMM